MFFIHTNNVQTIQNLYNYLTEAVFFKFFVHTNNVKTIRIVYKC